MATQSNAAVTVSSDSESYPSRVAAWYSIAVLMLMYVFSFIDRTTISLLVEPMKRDLHISDTQIGMLQGLAFALLYTFLGLPIARLSDRHSRRAIIAGGVFVWSIMATLCGLARSALQLFIARVGVGVGEAALSPAAYSIITDSFPRSKLGGAFGVYNVGITIGAGTALLVGGIVVGAVSRAGASYTLPLFGPVHAWQMVFILTGAPGIVLPLLLLTFREPKRRGLLLTQSGNEEAVAPGKPPLREVMSYAWQNRKFYGLLAADRVDPRLWGEPGAGGQNDWRVHHTDEFFGDAIGGRAVRSADEARLEGRTHRGRRDFGLRDRGIQQLHAVHADRALGVGGAVRCRHHVQRLQRRGADGRQPGHAQSISGADLRPVFVRGQCAGAGGGPDLGAVHQ